MRPVLLVHGIWDTAARLEPLRRGLAARGLSALHPVELRPNTGAAPLEQLATTLGARVETVCAEAGVDRVDVVGFSMGALVARVYLQRLGGHGRVRRFVSVSGPHQGTRMAWALPLAGVRQIRPGSELLRALAADREGLRGVEVHSLYTPFDAMVHPAETAIVPGSASVHRLPVALHRWMITDPRSLDTIAALLHAP